MDFLGIGFSDIRIPEKEGRHMYEYKRTNLFPEEVFIHEFLHTLERNSKEFGYAIPELHAYEQYGYENNDFFGLKDWYSDYMSQSIVGQNEYLGIEKDLYTISKPINEDNFINSKEMEFDKEPRNFVELIELFIYNSKRLIKGIKEGEVIRVK